MKNTLAAATLAAIVAATTFAGYVQHVSVDVSDSRQNYAIRVARGEVIDLSIDYFDEGEPLDISGSESLALLLAPITVTGDNSILAITQATLTR